MEGAQAKKGLAMLQIFLGVKKSVADQSPANLRGLTPNRGNPRVMPNSWAGRVSVTLSENIGHPFSLDSERDFYGF